MARAILVGLVFLFVVLTLVVSPGSSRVHAAQQIHVLFFGDSTVHGLSGNEYLASGGWRGSVISRLRETHDVRPVGRKLEPASAEWGPFEATSTAASALEMMPDVFAALERPPDIIILSFGINDGANNGWPIPTARHTLAAPMTTLVMEAASRAPAAEIYVCTIPVLNWGAASTSWSLVYNASLPLAVNDAYVAGARASLVDCTSGLWSVHDPENFWYLSDPVHPNQAGYDQMAENIYRALRQLSPLLKLAA